MGYLLLVLLLLPSITWAESGRFFYEGNGKITIQNRNRGTTQYIQYRLPDGSYPIDAQKTLDGLFGMPSEQLGEGVSLRLISFLDFLEDQFSSGKTILLLSGYRSPTLNAKLRQQGKLASETSYHMDGMAADVIFPGANSQKVWEFGKELSYGGIGNYGGKEIHLDSGKPRFWTAASALPKTKEPPLNKNIYSTSEIPRA